MLIVSPNPGLGLGKPADLGLSPVELAGLEEVPAAAADGWSALTALLGSASSSSCAPFAGCGKPSSASATAGFWDAEVGSNTLAVSVTPFVPAVWLACCRGGSSSPSSSTGSSKVWTATGLPCEKIKYCQGKAKMHFRVPLEAAESA